MMALRQQFFPTRTAHEPVTQAAALYSVLQKKPAWLRESRIGHRLNQALAYLKDQGSTDEFSDYLKDLAELDDEKTYANYGLVRFICWVTPMLGFLGTVVHFGTALGGNTAADIGEKLPTVVAEMGTAFNTTTVAVGGRHDDDARDLSVRADRKRHHSFDRSPHRAGTAAPLRDGRRQHRRVVSALQTATQANQRVLDATIQRQLDLWQSAFQASADQIEKRQQAQAQIWEEALVRLEERFATNDVEREKRLLP